MQRDAFLSSCGTYRWLLTRVWDPFLPLLVFIMLNPSKADGEVDDATVRVCMGRAIRMGAGGILVANLFAYRATHVKDMKAAADPVGDEHDYWIINAITRNNLMVIAAWGDDGRYLGREAKVVHICREHKVPLYCLGTTKAGSPKHPLRIAYSVQPVIWKEAA